MMALTVILYSPSSSAADFIKPKVELSYAEAVAL
jgi:hypothetical protein